MFHDFTGLLQGSNSMLLVFSHSLHPKYTRYEKFTNVVSDSTLQIRFKKIQFFKFKYRIKGECPQLSEKEIIKEIYKKM